MSFAARVKLVGHKSFNHIGLCKVKLFGVVDIKRVDAVFTRQFFGCSRKVAEHRTRDVFGFGSEITVGTMDHRQEYDMLIGIFFYKPFDQIPYRAAVCREQPGILVSDRCAAKVVGAALYEDNVGVVRHVLVSVYKLIITVCAESRAGNSVVVVRYVVPLSKPIVIIHTRRGCRGIGSDRVSEAVYDNIGSCRYYIMRYKLDRSDRFLKHINVAFCAQSVLSLGNYICVACGNRRDRAVGSNRCDGRIFRAENNAVKICVVRDRKRFKLQCLSDLASHRLNVEFDRLGIV